MSSRTAVFFTVLLLAAAVAAIVLSRLFREVETSHTRAPAALVEPRA